MREHFLQNKHFTIIPPSYQLPWSQDEPPQEPQLRNWLAVWGSEPWFFHLQTGFPSLVLSFPSVKWGKVASAHMESVRMN